MVQSSSGVIALASYRAWQRGMSWEGDVKMTEYRLYTVENDGHFIGSRTFTADSDDDAVVWAKQQIEDHSVELWSGPRLVRRLDPAEKRDAEAVTHTIEAGRMLPKNKT